jgi:hypothetical protein
VDPLTLTQCPDTMYSYFEEILDSVIKRDARRTAPEVG